MSLYSKMMIQRKFILIIGLLLLINAAAFIIPGMPGNLLEISFRVSDLKPPDLVVFYTSEYITDFLSVIGPEGRQAYQLMHLITDFSFPLLYGILFFLLIKYFTPSHRQRIRWLSFFPTVMDLCENFSLVYITHLYPIQEPVLAVIAQISTILKFSLIIFNVITIGYLRFRFHKKDSNHTLPEG